MAWSDAGAPPTVDALEDAAASAATATDAGQRRAEERPRSAAGQAVGRRRRWPLRLLLTFGLVGLVATVAVLAQGLGRDPTLIRSPLIGKPAPAFDLAAVDGGRVTSADFAGRPYVVNFWATWCTECRKEHPYLMSFYERWAPQGVGMVGIVYNDTLDKVRAFREEMGAEDAYPDVMDPGGRTALDFGVYGVPETFVVDEDGIVVAKLIGAATPGSLDRIMQRLLVEPERPSLAP